MKRLKISVVLPCHNEERNIYKLVHELEENIGEHTFEYILVDDASTDNTPSVVDRLAKENEKIKVIHRKPPCGLGRALKDGYRMASGDQILSIDSDFAMDPKEVPKLIEKFQEGKWDVVIGSRYYRGTRLYNYPINKLIANRVFHFIFRLLLGIRVSDLTNNFKLFRKNVVKSIEWQSNNFAILAETGIFPAISGYKIVEVPVKWIQRSAGKSKFDVTRLAPSYIKVGLKALHQKYFKSFV